MGKASFTKLSRETGVDLESLVLKAKAKGLAPDVDETELRKVLFEKIEEVKAAAQAALEQVDKGPVILCLTFPKYRLKTFVLYQPGGSIDSGAVVDGSTMDVYSLDDLAGLAEPFAPVSEPSPRKHTVRKGVSNTGTRGTKYETVVMPDVLKFLSNNRAELNRFVRAQGCKRVEPSTSKKTLEERGISAPEGATIGVITPGDFMRSLADARYKTKSSEVKQYVARFKEDSFLNELPTELSKPTDAAKICGWIEGKKDKWELKDKGVAFYVRALLTMRGITLATTDPRSEWYYVATGTEFVRSDPMVKEKILTQSFKHPSELIAYVTRCVIDSKSHCAEDIGTIIRGLSGESRCKSINFYPYIYIANKKDEVEHLVRAELKKIAVESAKSTYGLASVLHDAMIKDGAIDKLKKNLRHKDEPISKFYAKDVLIAFLSTFPEVAKEYGYTLVHKK